MIAVLLSGGMDSATALYLAVKHQGPKNVCAVFVDYGQLAAKQERAASWAIADRAGTAWATERMTLDRGSSITGSAGDLTGPSTVVPDRNHRLIDTASIYGGEVWYGPNRDDWAIYEDCRPDFVRQFRKVVAPFLYLFKRDIVVIGNDLGVPWELTWSCYAPVGGEMPCGTCGACIERRKALAPRAGSDG